MLNIKKNIILAPHTTFKIGGPAKYFIEVNSKEEIIEAANWAKEKNLPIFVLGGGSHIVISDRGFDGLVIKIQNSKFQILNYRVTAWAGTPLAKLVVESTKSGLTGLEWAIGIPGTLGGAVCNNSGAYARAIADIFESAEVFSLKDLIVEKFKKNDCHFRYRESVFKRNSDLIILSASLKLKRSKKKEIKNTMKEFVLQRAKSNPSGHSAGCYFKNIEWSRRGIKKEEILQKFPATSAIFGQTENCRWLFDRISGPKGEKSGRGRDFRQTRRFYRE